MRLEAYVVAWQSKVSGASGSEEKQRSRADCEGECEKLNRLYPKYHHYPARAVVTMARASSQGDPPVRREVARVSPRPRRLTTWEALGRALEVFRRDGAS